MEIIVNYNLAECLGKLSFISFFTAHLRLQTFLEKTSLTVAIIISSTGKKVEIKIIFIF